MQRGGQLITATRATPLSEPRELAPTAHSPAEIRLNMNSRLEAWSTALLAACAVVVTVLYGADRVRVARAEPGQSARLERIAPTTVGAIDSVALGRRQHSRSVLLTEFIDLECPFCAAFARRLDSARVLLGDSLEIRYANFPLSNHRFARSGAAAVECAFKLGDVDAFVRAVYAQQDSLGFWTWERYAAVARIPDSVGFASCRNSKELAARVELALQLAERLNLRGTPSLFVGAHRYDRPPSLEVLLADIRRVSRDQ